MEKHLLDAALEQVWKRRREKRLSLNWNAQPQRRSYWHQNQPLDSEQDATFRTMCSSSPGEQERHPQCPGSTHPGVSQKTPRLSLLARIQTDTAQSSLLLKQVQSQAVACAGAMTPCSTTKEEGST